MSIKVQYIKTYIQIEVIMKKLAHYIKIEQDLTKQIENQTFPSGSQLPTEKEIAAQYGVSRTTANKALTALMTKGLIVRIQGKGTFVQNKRVEKDIRTGGSFTKDMLSTKQIPGAILIDYRVLRANHLAKVQAILNLRDNDLVHYIHRVRLGDQTPIALSKTYIPCKYLAYLDVNVLDHSLYRYLNDSWNIHPKIIDYKFSARLPNDNEKKLLKIGNTALLESVHVNIDDANNLFEYTETLYVGSRYTYHLSLNE